MSPYWAPCTALHYGSMRPKSNTVSFVFSIKPWHARRVAQSANRPEFILVHGLIFNI